MTSIHVWGLSSVLLFVAGCGGSDDLRGKRGNDADVSCAVGTERCECYRDGTCNPGLTCGSRLCVALGGAGGTTSSGDASTSGTTSSGGAARAGAGGIDRGAGGADGAGEGGSRVDGGSPITETEGGLIIIGPIGSGDGGTSGCIGSVKPTTAVQPDILIMFDQSTSMACALPTSGDRWGALKKALQDYVVLPDLAGLRVGIQYFGLGGMFSSCASMDYQTPEVEIAPLSKNAQPIVVSLDNHSPSTNTPTTAALTGAINHAIDWKNGHPGHPVVVLLVTDGEPNSCGVTSDVVAVASAGLMNTIPTYVIGVTSPGSACIVDPNPPNQQNLDAVAKAGGTSAASIVDVTKAVGPQFAAAMNDIRAKSTVPCTFPLPPAGQLIDAHKVNVQYTPAGTATPVRLAAIQSLPCDPKKGGWYFDNVAAPTQITLCPSTCNAVAGSAVDVVYGCATIYQ